MKLTLIVSGLAVTALMSGGVFAQDVFVYESVDQNGVTTFSDVPPAGAESTVTGMRSQRTNNSGVQARVDAARETAAANSAVDSVKSEVEAENARIAAENEIIREKNCQESRNRLKTYLEAPRLFRTGEDGERQYLSAEEIDVARAEAEELVREWCGNR